MNWALYTFEWIEWCMSVLFIHYLVHIYKYCLVNSILSPAIMTITLDWWLWAVSSLKAEKLQIRCLTEMHFVHISPPLQIANIESGCERYCPNIYILMKSKLTGAIDTSAQRYFLTTFIVQYQIICNYRIWYRLTWNSNRWEETRIGDCPFWVPPMTLNHLNKRI